MTAVLSSGELAVTGVANHKVRKFFKMLFQGRAFHARGQTMHFKTPYNNDLTEPDLLRAFVGASVFRLVQGLGATLDDQTEIFNLLLADLFPGRQNLVRESLLECSLVPVSAEPEISAQEEAVGVLDKRPPLS